MPRWVDGGGGLVDSETSVSSARDSTTTAGLLGRAAPGSAAGMGLAGVGCFRVGVRRTIVSAKSALHDSASSNQLFPNAILPIYGSDSPSGENGCCEGGGGGPCARNLPLGDPRIAKERVQMSRAELHQVENIETLPTQAAGKVLNREVKRASDARTHVAARPS